jgi:hypothetical protein
MFDHEEDDEPDRTQGHRGDMSVLDKMRMWMSKAGQDHTVHSKEKFFVGVRDDEEDSIDQSELSAYHNIIVESPAYQWLLTNMAKESNLQLGTPQPRIRQRILDKLPTGTISKRRSPDIHEVTFELRWEDAMEEYFRYELPEQRRLSNRSFQSFVVLTGSPREAQGLTLEQYLAQTWPTAGLQLLFSLHAAVINHSHLHTVDLPGNTRLSTRILHSRLIVTSTGPAYYVADCGEILAWIWSALLGNIRNLTGFCLPLMTSFRIDAAPSNSTLQKYRGYCNFGFELTQREISDESLPGIQNFSRDLLGENAIILGFPIRRRPEGYPGLELSFDTLLLYLEAPKAEIFVLDVFIKGPRRMLKLIKHTEDVFLWRLDHSLADYSSCCTDHLSKALSCKDYSYLDHHALEAGRHILSKCADDAAPPKGMYRAVLA